jgi:hypothetical protein
MNPQMYINMPTSSSRWSVFLHHSAPSHCIYFHILFTSTANAFTRIFCPTRAKFLANPTSLQFIFQVTFDTRDKSCDAHYVILTSHLLTSFFSIQRCSSASYSRTLTFHVAINIIIWVYIVQQNLCSLTIVYCVQSYMFRPIHMAIFRLLREEGFCITIQLYYNYITSHTRSRIMCTTVVW